MRIGVIQFTQRVGKREHIIAITASGSGRTGYMGSQLRQRSGLAAQVLWLLQPQGNSELRSDKIRAERRHVVITGEIYPHPLRS